MRRLILAILLSVALTSAFAQGSDEEQSVRQTTDTVLEQLRSNRQQLGVQPEFIQQLVRDLIIPHFDFDTITRLVMDHYWEMLAPQDRQCLIQGLRNTVVERYAYILLSYDDHNISYGPHSQVGEEGVVVIRQTISREGMEPLRVEYAMKQGKDGWNAVDLIVDGVSLARNYRGIYQGRIHQHGIRYFLDNLDGCAE